MTKEELDRINRAEEIQLYTENRCKALEKENAELKNKIRFMGEQIDNLKAIAKYDQLTKAKELLERLLITSCNSDVLNLLPNCSEVLRVRVEAEQFLSEVEK